MMSLRQCSHSIAYFWALTALLVALPRTSYSQDFTIDVTPEDTTVVVGDSLQFTAAVLDSAGDAVDTTVTWSVVGTPVGSIDSTGLFTASAVGLGFVRASLGAAYDQATIFVQDSTLDTTGTQTILLIRVKRNPNATPDTIEVPEGTSYVLGGFQYPLNVLNDGVLAFPNGSLHEDIFLTIFQPKFVHSDSDTIIYPPGIVAAADFEVSVGDSVISPYFFDQPLLVAIPFKRGLLRHLGLSPYDLGVFFYDDSTGYDSTGIDNVVVDSVSNRIFASIIHFSDVVLASREAATGLVDRPGASLPAGYALAQNYPNPFNATTVIRYALPLTSDVSLVVYNLLGQEVIRWSQRNIPPGYYTQRWNGTNNVGRPVTSGVYFYRIVAGDFAETKKMVVLK